MYYDNLADLVMVVHTLLILSIFIGILVSVRYKRFRPLEATGLLSAVVIWSLFGGCPLTNLENYFRVLAGNPLPLTEIGFISFYVKKWLFITITDQQVIMTTYIIVALFIAVSVEWIHPFVNPEIAQIRQFINKLKRRLMM